MISARQLLTSELQTLGYLAGDLVGFTTTDLGVSAIVRVAENGAWGPVSIPRTEMQLPEAELRGLIRRRLTGAFQEYQNTQVSKTV